MPPKPAAAAAAAAAKPKPKRVVLSHPRGSGFRFDKRRKAIFHVASKRVLPGLLNTNRKAFYPKYTFERATRDTVVSHTYNTTMSAPVNGDGEARSTTRRGSLKRGTLLDTQMGRTMTFFKRYKLSHAFFFDADVRRAWTTTDVPAHVRAYCNKVAPFTRACWKTFFELGLFPVAWQVVVGCTRMKRGTLLDMVCKNTEGQYVVIEFKSGFNSYYYKWTGHYMRAPFGAQTDCAFNQHQIQLLMGTELYRRCYWPGESLQSSNRLGTPLLMRFRTTDDDGVAADVHPLRPWALEALPAAVACFTRA
jgi:hypothetical protein